SFDHLSHIEVSGHVIQTVITTIKTGTYINNLFEKYHLNNVQKTKFYPLKKVLCLYHDIDQRIPAIMRLIGEKIIKEAIFPPLIDFEQVLMTTTQAYYLNHKGCVQGEIGTYICNKISDTEYLLTVDVPYPCSFDEGIFYGYAAYFHTPITVEHATKECRRNGDKKCVYRVLLKKS
ncbi:MAG: hypothetical protein HQK93_06765, partial [Nitrospirae bacterium]|nr:hypothetical protein [Nitrospirota bacterium]